MLQTLLILIGLGVLTAINAAVINIVLVLLGSPIHYISNDSWWFYIVLTLIELYIINRFSLIDKILNSVRNYLLKD